MNQNQTEVQAVQAVAIVRPMVSAMTKAFGASVSNAQLNFIVSMAFDCLPLTLNDKTFKYSDYMTKLEQEMDYALARKTIENSMTVTRKMIDEHQVKMAQYENSEIGVMAFVHWVRDQLATTTYTAARDDLLNWLKGAPSKADMRKREAEQEAEARRVLAERQQKEAEAAAQAAKQVPTPQPLADVVAQQEAQAEAEAEAQAEQEKLAQEQAARDEKAAQEEKAKAMALAAEREQARQLAEQQAQALAQAQEQAEEARKQADSMVIRVSVDKDGKPVVFVAENQNPVFLEAVAKELNRIAKARRQAQKTAMAA